MLKENLCQIGFTDSESKVYLKLLQLGPQAVSVVAKRTYLNRTTTYSILRALEKKGMVSSYKNKSIQFFSANDPNSLVGYLDGKCKTYDYYRSQLLLVLPQFRNLMGGYGFKKPIVSYFDGIDGVSHVMNDALTAKSEFRCYLPIHKQFEIFSVDLKNFHITNDKVVLRIITPDTDEVRAFLNKKKFSDSKVLYVSDSNCSGMFGNLMNIYDDKVAIMSLNKGDEYGVLIQNKEIAEMHKVIFDMTWGGFEIGKIKKAS